jgi:hypothetical protein
LDIAQAEDPAALSVRLFWGEVYELPVDREVANQLYLKNRTGCAGFPDHGFVDLNINQIMEWFYANRVTAARYVAILSDSRMAETQQALREHKSVPPGPRQPDAAKALEHLAMKPPLELADWCGQIRAESGGEHGHRRRNIRGGSRST